MLEYLYNKLIMINTKLRSSFWRLLFSHFGKNTYIFGRIIVYSPKNIFIGYNSTLNEGCLLNARDKIIIGSHVHISPMCILNTGGLDYKNFKEKRIHIKKPIIIKDGVWVGSGVIINPGITIEENSVVGAGAVVTKDVSKNSIVVGVPAKIIGTLD